MERHETRTIEGRKVHYTPHEGGDLVMLVRLAGASGGVWDSLWPRLATRHAVASVELGKPDMARTPRAVFDEFAGVTLAAATALGHRRVHLVGWNGGAHIALAAAAQAPPQLASLVLMTPFRDVGERRQIDHGLDILELLLRTNARELYAYHWFMAGFSDRFVEEKFDTVDRLAQQRLANDGFLGLDVDRAMRWMRALRRDHVSDTELAAIRLPTLIMAAGLNRWHAGPTLAMATALHAAIPDSRITTFAACGGFFPIEAPDETAAEMLTFLEEGTAPTQDYQ